MMKGDLQNDCLGFFCSNSCPGDVILKAQDWANSRDTTSKSIISGFHTSIEKEVLRLLIRNGAPVIYVLGRAMEGWRKPRDIAAAIKAGSLVAISPFAPDQKRTTAQSAAFRNNYIVSRAEAVLIAHASASGKTEALAQSVLDQGKGLFTFTSPSNAHLIEMGAVCV